MDMTTLIGIAGASTVLGAFAKTQLNHWTANSRNYLIANLVGAILLLVYSYLLKSYPFIILNLVWGLVALSGLIRKKTVK